jgi:hypothetical protein
MATLAVMFVMGAANVWADIVAPVLQNCIVSLEMTLSSDSWKGDGIYLGQGLVLTARHITNPLQLTHPKIHMGNLVLSGEPLREGAAVDLALLRIDQKKLPAVLQHHLVSLCVEPPREGQAIVTVSSAGIARSAILHPASLPKNTPAQFRTAIEDRPGTGNSGSGVFDEKTNCMFGIVSRRIDKIVMTNSKLGSGSTRRESVGKAFEPADTIREFISQWMH